MICCGRIHKRFLRCSSAELAIGWLYLHAGQINLIYRLQEITVGCSLLYPEGGVMSKTYDYSETPRDQTAE